MRKEIILGENIPSEILPLFFLRKMGDLMWGTEQRKATTGNVDLSQIIQLVQRMKNLLGSDSRVYAEYEGPNLPLTRYLNKIVSLHVSADVLVRYACSPRLRTHFMNKSLF